MKLMDKLKNALFEEEYVEVEERPKQKVKKEKVKTRPEKPIAKKISVPERPKQERKVENSYDEQDEFKEEKELLDSVSEFRFPAMADDDFSVTQPFNIIEEEPEKVKEPPMHKEKPLYQSSKKDTKSDYENYANRDYVGAYEKKQEHTGFRPSPIISPIYGVLDKNYTKEEVKEKREVRISTFSRDDLDLDAVRRKAYGSLEDEIVDFSGPESVASPIEEEEENLLVDLSYEDTPTVNKVTVGDAEEYFEDLGLEYNKDYIDASKEKANGRRVKEENTPPVYEEEEQVVEEDKDKDKAKQKPVLEDNDNLFDLIDSMYNEE